MILSLSPTLGACVAPSGLTPDRGSAETAPARPRRAGRSAAHEPSPRVPDAAVPATSLRPLSRGLQIILYFQLCCCSHYRFGGYKC